MNYIIRKMIKDDCAKVAHIVTIAWNETYSGIVSDAFLKNLYQNETERANNSFINFDDKDNHKFVIEIDNEVVGFVNVGESDENDYANFGELYAIYLLKKYQGYGFGKKLFEAGVQELKSMGFDKMVIGCLDKNSANEFYKHLGGKFIKQRVFTRLNLPENVYIFVI